MLRRLAVLGSVVAALALAPVAYGHPFNPPEGGLGDTPQNSSVARAEAGDNYAAAVTSSGGAAANSLFRNPTCAAHNDHPPGNP